MVAAAVVLGLAINNVEWKWFVWVRACVLAWAERRWHFSLLAKNMPRRSCVWVWDRHMRQGYDVCFSPETQSEGPIIHESARRLFWLLLGSEGRVWGRQNSHRSMDWVDGWMDWTERSYKKFIILFRQWIFIDPILLWPFSVSEMEAEEEEGKEKELFSSLHNTSTTTTTPTLSFVSLIPHIQPALRRSSKKFLEARQEGKEGSKGSKTNILRAKLERDPKNFRPTDFSSLQDWLCTERKQKKELLFFHSISLDPPSVRKTFRHENGRTARVMNLFGGYPVSPKAATGD